MNAITRSLSDSYRNRATTAASANTETVKATVKKTYANSLGFITHADVLVPGQTTPLRSIENATASATSPLMSTYRTSSRRWSKA